MPYVCKEKKASGSLIIIEARKIYDIIVLDYF